MNADIQRQISVAIENQPGRLGRVCRMLAERGVAISGFSVIDNIEQGMMRLVVDDPTAARNALDEAGLPVVEAEVLTIEIANGVGALADIGESMARAEINIEYAYATCLEAGEATKLVLKTADAYEALAALRATQNAD